jgi:DNA-binding response OmpR family regulator
MRVLVVEDNTDLAQHIREGLRDRGIAADTAHDGATALHKSLATPSR